MAQCIATLKVCQAADERYPYGFNLTDAFSRLWEASFPYLADSVVRSDGNPAYGREFKASADGTSGDDEPEWPSTNAGEVDDGSLHWVSQPMSFNGLAYRITGAVWTAPAGITADSATYTDLPSLQQVRVWISGGVRGRKYVIVGQVSATDGTETAMFEVRLEVKIE